MYIWYFLINVYIWYFLEKSVPDCSYVYSAAKDYVAVRQTLPTRQSVQPANNSTMDPQHALYPTD